MVQWRQQAATCRRAMSARLGMAVPAGRFFLPAGTAACARRQVNTGRSLWLPRGDPPGPASVRFEPAHAEKWFRTAAVPGGCGYVRTSPAASKKIAGGDRLQGGLAAIRCGGLCSVRPDGQPQPTDRKSRRNAARPASAGGAAALPPSPISAIHTITHSRSTLAKEWGARGEGNAGR